MPRANRTSHQVIVIGAGIAGLAAATEAARCGLKCALFDDGLLGGLITNVGALHGHPGGDETTGADLVATMLGEALAAEVDYLPGAVTELTATGEHWTLPGNDAAAPHIVLATGAELRTLDVPGEEQLSGRGVSQCAYCDGGLYGGQDVAVVGGGDGAFQEALHLAELCRTVTMILRGQRPRARPTFVKQAADQSQMQFRWRTEVREIVGESGVEAVRLHDRDGDAEEVLPIAAIFPFIGLAPRTTLAPPEARRDDAGGLIVDADMLTDRSGLYAVGAVRAGHGGQIAHAIADAKTAAHGAWRAERSR